MKKKEAIVRFVGSAGDGLASLGELFGKILKMHNLNVLGFRSYQSVIRGGYNAYQIRVSSDPVYSVGEDADIIVLLNKDVAIQHKPLVNSGAIVIYDNERINLDELDYPDDISKLGIPFTSLAKQVSNLRVIKNIVGFGSIAYILSLDFDIIAEVLEEQFGYKGKEIVDINIKALELGLKYAEENNWPIIWEKHKFERAKQMLISGNIAIAMGMVAAGLKFYSGYPMTPATSILHYLTKYLPDLKIIVKQTEDELAAVGMAVGASYAGVRAATGTSGGGMALMTEIMGMSAMEEIPLVVINSQRAGPSTGMATKTEQADLFQSLGASQGEFPRIIIAPSDVPDAFYTGIEALELAEKYQTLVVVLLDLYLSEQIASVKSLPLKRKNKRFEILEKVPEDFKRFEITETGVSPRPLPGTPGGMHFTGSSEHNEKGFSIASTLAGLPDTLEIRKAMMQKRMRKLKYILQDLEPPKLDGPEDAEVTLVSWGSTKLIVKEAMLKLNEIGIKTNQLHIKYLEPLHEEQITEVLNKAKTAIAVEQNFTGQMRNLVRMKTGILIPHLINRYDGEPITVGEIVNQVKEIVKND